MKSYLNLFVLIVILLAAQSWAGTTGKLVGRVVDKQTGEPLIGVNVFLEGTSLGATTDLEGHYIILNIPPGKYTVVAQYVGYREVRMENVPIKIDLTTTRNFQLEEATLELDEAIVVEGRRDYIQKDITASQASGDAEEIENLPVSELDDVLQLQAGVTRDAGGGFHIRGGRSSEIAYWVNGVSITDVYDNSQGIQIDNNSVQELQVISGTFNAEYGNAMSGIVNMATKEGGKKYSGDLEVYFGDYVSDFTSYFPHIDDFNPVANHNFQGSLSGPVIPGGGEMFTFFATARYNYSDGHLYGTRYFEPTGEPGDSAVVPMDWSERFTGHAKVTFKPTGTLKFNAEILASAEDFQDYNHGFRWNPEGDVNKFSDSYNTWFSMTHTLSQRTFYELNVSYFNKKFEEYLYEDPHDDRYMHPDSLITPVDLSFLTRGTNLHRFYRETNTFVVKGDFTSQVTRRHLIKGGVQFKWHELAFDDYNLEPKRVDNVPVEPFEPAIPDEDQPNRTKYNQNPYEFSAYLQDKIEYESVIINAGLRLDYFNSNARILEDPRDPNINNPLRTNLDMTNLEDAFYKDATPKWQLSPRFGIAYPISASGVIHFSYGHFLQIPSFQYLYNRGDYEVPQTGSRHGPYGNPDLEPQRTVQYEIGLQQEFMRDFKVDVTGFYKDIRNWISTSAFIETYIAGNSYSKYINKDYANIRGLTLVFKKRYSDYYSFDMSYTFQIVEGSNSSPEDQFNALRSNAEPTLYLLPLDWDQRHLFNLSLYVGSETWGGSIISRYGTGLPYTPQITQYTSDRGISSGLQENSRRKPSQFSLDLKLHKGFNWMGYRFLTYLRVFNLLDTRIPINVFGDTGEPDYTTQYLNRQPDQERPNTIAEYIRYPWHYGEPRRFQFGIEFSF